MYKPEPRAYGVDQPAGEVHSLPACMLQAVDRILGQLRGRAMRLQTLDSTPNPVASYVAKYMQPGESLGCWVRTASRCTTVLPP